MAIRGLNKNRDWQFGQGKNSYVEEEKELAENLETRVMSFLGDCFWATDEGIDWWNLLDYNQQEKLEYAVQEVITNTPGVTGVNSVDIIQHANRRLSIEYNINTIYSNNYTGTAVTPSLSVTPIPTSAPTEAPTEEPAGSPIINIKGLTNAVCNYNDGDVIDPTKNIEIKPDWGYFLGNESYHYLIGEYFYNYDFDTFDTASLSFVKVGSPTITENGIASGFSNSNYITTSYSMPTSNFEINMKFKSAELSYINNCLLYTNNGSFVADEIGLYFRYNYRAFTLGVNYTNSGGWEYLLLNKAYLAFQANTDYYAKIINDSKGWEVLMSEDNENWTTLGDEESTVTLNPQKTHIVFGRYTTLSPEGMSGFIALPEFSITVDGAEAFNGSRSEQSIIIDTSNITESITILPITADKYGVVTYSGLRNCSCNFLNGEGIYGNTKTTLIITADDNFSFLSEVYNYYIDNEEYSFTMSDDFTTLSGVLPASKTANVSFSNINASSTASIWNRSSWDAGVWN